MRRREFITMLGAATVSLPAPLHAQNAGKDQKIGFLYPASQALADGRIAFMLEGLRSAGSRQLEQVEVVSRATGGDQAKITPMLAELVDKRVDVIVVVSPAAVRAAREATATIPIIAHDLESDPVGGGLVASLNRPGGNLTGFFFDFPDFGMKWLELMSEAIPNLRQIAVLWDPATGPIQPNAIKAAARARNIKLNVIEVRAAADLENAFGTASQTGAALILSSPIFGTDAKSIADLTLRHKLPAITLFPEFARFGGLMAYGPNLPESFRQVGIMAAKILMGTKPADLPIQRPAKFELVVNLKTAKAIGVTLATSVLLRADEVIE